jgi:hypothetical protein
MTTIAMVKSMGYIKEAIIAFESSSRELLKLGGIQAVADRIVESPEAATSKTIERRPKLVISDGVDEIEISIDEFPDLVKKTIDQCVKIVSADLDNARRELDRKMKEIEL